MPASSRVDASNPPYLGLAIARAEQCDRNDSNLHSARSRTGRSPRSARSRIQLQASQCLCCLHVRFLTRPELHCLRCASISTSCRLRPGWHALASWCRSICTASTILTPFFASGVQRWRRSPPTLPTPPQKPRSPQKPPTRPPAGPSFPAPWPAWLLTEVMWPSFFADTANRDRPPERRSSCKNRGHTFSGTDSLRAIMNLITHTILVP